MSRGSRRDAGVPTPIADYAMIGDLHTAALISSVGSIDWLCLPRFDSPAFFAALLDSEDAGRWTLAPAGGVVDVHRSYLPDTFVLKTRGRPPGGDAEVWDFMPLGDQRPNIVRRIRGVRGSVTFGRRSPSASTTGPPSPGSARRRTATSLPSSRRPGRRPSSAAVRRCTPKVSVTLHSSRSATETWSILSLPGIRLIVIRPRRSMWMTPSM